MEPVFNPDGTQAISASECERYVNHLRTLSDRDLARELEKWQGFSRNKAEPWADQRVVRTCRL